MVTNTIKHENYLNDNENRFNGVTSVCEVQNRVLSLAKFPGTFKEKCYQLIVAKHSI